MNWLNGIFKKSAILTDADRLELERIEKEAEPYLRIRERIEKDFISSGDRLGHLRKLSEQLVANPQDETIYAEMLQTACMPATANEGWQHIEAAKRPFDEKIEAIRQSSVMVVRKVFQRALEAAETELQKLEAAEKRQSESEGYPYVPSGKILALQERALSLRNEVAARYGFEGAIQSPPHWRERLQNWL